MRLYLNENQVTFWFSNEVWTREFADPLAAKRSASQMINVLATQESTHSAPKETLTNSFWKMGYRRLNRGKSKSRAEGLPESQRLELF